jgi:hypothetical protein
MGQFLRNLKFYIHVPDRRRALAALISDDVHRLHRRDRRQAPFLAPGKELAHRLRVGAAGIAVANVGREEFKKAQLGALAGGGDKGRGGVSGEGDKLVHYDEGGVVRLSVPCTR